MRPEMPGTLTLDALKTAVSSGEIDTVLVAAIDMQGRLVGKRFHAAFFVNGGHEETHCCNYLLAVDMEMTPSPATRPVAGKRAMATTS
jgi:glutamine synthetase